MFFLTLFNWGFKNLSKIFYNDWEESTELIWIKLTLGDTLQKKKDEQFLALKKGKHALNARFELCQKAMRLFFKKYFLVNIF